MPLKKARGLANSETPCISKFMPKMHKNTFGGRAPSGPAGGA